MLLRPVAPTTTTSTVPAPWAGALTLSRTGDSTMKRTADEAPKSTAEIPSKPRPTTTTQLPPAVGPRRGLTLLTTGGSMTAATGPGTAAGWPVTVVPVAAGADWSGAARPGAAEPGTAALAAKVPPGLLGLLTN